MPARIAALFVERDGVYQDAPDVDAWDLARDARLYRGPWRVVAHPPCARWGKFWPGAPMSTERFHLGDDSGCFASALWSVRSFGGVIEHPADSLAWGWHGMPRPGLGGWWGPRDKYGGATCCVAQGNYGHPAPKLTWLYGKLGEYPDLNWDPSDAPGRVETMSRKARKQTPVEFRDVLLSMVRAG